MEAGGWLTVPAVSTAPARPCSPPLFTRFQRLTRSTASCPWAVFSGAWSSCFSLGPRHLGRLFSLTRIGPKSQLLRRTKSPCWIVEGEVVRRAPTDAGLFSRRPGLGRRRAQKSSGGQVTPRTLRQPESSTAHAALLSRFAGGKALARAHWVSCATGRPPPMSAAVVHGVGAGRNGHGNGVGLCLDARHGGGPDWRRATSLPLLDIPAGTGWAVCAGWSSPKVLRWAAAEASAATGLHHTPFPGLTAHRLQYVMQPVAVSNKKLLKGSGGNLSLPPRGALRNSALLRRPSTATPRPRHAPRLCQ